ncbi:MAG: hypothetical protein AAFV29_23390, partial [Myxococcota bacterium]
GGPYEDEMHEGTAAVVSAVRCEREGPSPGRNLCPPCSATVIGLQRVIGYFEVPARLADYPNKRYALKQLHVGFCPFAVTEIPEVVEQADGTLRFELDVDIAPDVALELDIMSDIDFLGRPTRLSVLETNPLGRTDVDE